MELKFVVSDDYDCCSCDNDDCVDYDDDDDFYDDDFYDEGYYDAEHTTVPTMTTTINLDPTPPPEILTPALYAKMNRAAIVEEQVKKSKAKKRFGCFSASNLRALFSRGRND